MSRIRPAPASRVSTVGPTTSVPVIDALTGVRAVAAVVVIVWHLQAVIYPLLPATRAAENLIFNGFLSVDVFFVLSGFIISYNYADRLAAPDRGSRGAFWWARFARIYPVHIVTLLMVAVLVAHAASVGTTLNPKLDFSAATFVGNLFALQALPGVSPWNVPSWSISCEVAAYIVFPFVATFLSRAGRTRAITLLVVVALGQFAAVYALSTWASFDQGGLAIALYWVRIAGGFSIGCLLWALWRHGVRPRRPDAIALLSLGAVAVVLAFDPKGPYVFLVMPLVGVFVLGTADARGIVRAVLASPVMEYGGRISFAIYLAHVPLIVVMTRYLPPSRFADDALWLRIGIVGVYIVASVIAGVVVYHLVEEPARKWLRRHPPRWARPAPRRTALDTARVVPATAADH